MFLFEKEIGKSFIYHFHYLHIIIQQKYERTFNTWKAR